MPIIPIIGRLFPRRATRHRRSSCRPPHSTTRTFASPAHRVASGGARAPIGVSPPVAPDGGGGCPSVRVGRRTRGHPMRGIWRFSGEFPDVEGLDGGRRKRSAPRCLPRSSSEDPHSISDQVSNSHDDSHTKEHHRSVFNRQKPKTGLRGASFAGAAPTGIIGRSARISQGPQTAS